jgi:hypothetical protein
MLRVERPTERTLLSGPARATGPTSLSPLLYVSHISLIKNIFLLTRAITCFAVPCNRQPAPLRIHRSIHLPPHVPSSCAARSSLLPVACPTHATRSLLPQSDLPRAHLRRRVRYPPLLVVDGAVACLRSVTTEPRAPARAPPCCGARALPLGAGSHSEAGINWPSLNWP